MILPESLTKIVLMAIGLTSVNAKVIEKETVIRDVGAARERNDAAQCGSIRCFNGAVCLASPSGDFCVCAEGYEGTTCSDLIDVNTARDCQEIQRTSSLSLLSGVYKIQPLGVSEPFDVYCDFDTDGGGWTVIQRRIDDSTNFDLGWNDYKVGIGDLKTNFWLGNEKIYSLTRQKRYQLRIELTNYYGTQYHAKYSQFSISDENHRYKLSIGSYSGNAGHDSLEYHDGMRFTTRDSDHDEYSGNCAERYHGGWWFNECRHSQLIGGFYWKGLTGEVNVDFSEMKIRAGFDDACDDLI